MSLVYRKNDIDETSFDNESWEREIKQLNAELNIDIERE
jgi:hypothetical protein